MAATLRTLDGSLAVGLRWSRALGLLACLACSSSEGSSSGPETDDGTFDPIEFRALNATAVCEPLARCCELSFEAIGGYEGCIALFVVASFESIAELGESIEAGRVAYDERRLRECSDASREMSCDDLSANRSDDACDSYLIPQVPTGGFCTTDVDCIDGYCENSTCVADHTLDEPCDEDWQCASSYCSDDDLCRPEDERELLCF